MACCKECQQIGKKMAKGKGSSKFMDGLKRAAAITAGIGAGAMVVPKVVDMIDKEGKFNPMIINAVGIGGAIWAARKQKGMLQDAFYGLAGGLGWNVASGFMNGVGYVDDFSTDLNRVAGEEGRGGLSFGSRPNPGAL